MSAQFEIVRGDATQPWLARWKSGNGREVFRTSETYKGRAGAENAILAFLRDHTRQVNLGDPELRWNAARDVGMVWLGAAVLATVVVLDERKTEPS